MPNIGRWMAIDPLAEKHPDWTPYNYVLANPLKFIDPDGRQVDMLQGYNDFMGARIPGSQAYRDTRNRVGLIGRLVVGVGFMLPEVVVWGQSLLVPFTTLMVKYGDKFVPIGEGILCGEACGFGNGSRISDEVAEQIGNVNSYWRAFGREGRFNCISCSIATDAVLGGRPASALPSAQSVKDDFYESVFGDVNWIRGVKPQDFMKYLPNSGDRGIINAFSGFAGHAFNVLTTMGL